MAYQCVTTSIAGFIQQLAVGYCAKDYHFYALGKIPPAKDPAHVDAKLVERYGVDLSYTTRCRRKQQGAASVQYVRYNDVFVLIATHGIHRFFDEEKASIKDTRKAPITVFGYAISHRNGHVHVRIARKQYTKLKKRFLKRAVRDTAAHVAMAFRCLPYQPYALIRSQVLCILRTVNQKRRACGLAPIADTCVLLQRKSVRPFGVQSKTARAA